MENKQNPDKLQLGSVAVDSETGVENYNQPKATGQPQASAPNSSPKDLRPNYREKTSGQAQNLAGVPPEFMNLFEHDPNEVIYMQALRHPIGVIGIYAMGGVAVLLTVVLYAFLLQDGSMTEGLGIDSTSAKAVGSLVTLLILAITLGITFLAAYVYKKSRMILTNQKVVLIQYHSLIAREVSQINIGEVEDVNVSQPNLIDRIFKTGRITIETAGEQNNYVLGGVEKPYEFARKTIQMHEGSIVDYGN